VLHCFDPDCPLVFHVKCLADHLAVTVDEDGRVCIRPESGVCPFCASPLLWSMRPLSIRATPAASTELNKPAAVAPFVKAAANPTSETMEMTEANKAELQNRKAKQRVRARVQNTIQAASREVEALHKGVHNLRDYADFLR
jgi:hypothetical protein